MNSLDTKQWLKAAEEHVHLSYETDAIELIVDKRLPKDRTLKRKWGFKKKYHVDGKLDKYRERCTIRGYTQRPRINFKEKIRTNISF